VTHLATYQPSKISIKIDGEQFRGLADDWFLEYDDPLTFVNIRFFITADINLNVGQEYNIEIDHPDLNCDVSGKLKLSSKHYNLGSSEYYVVFKFNKGE
jgi:hypothetical protein